TITTAFGTSQAATTTITYGTCCDRVLQVKDALNFITSFTYDGVGNRLTATDPLSHTTTYTYDRRNRISTRVNGANETTSYAYDDNLLDALGLNATFPNFAALVGDLGFTANVAEGSAVAVTDPTGAKTLTIRDAVGRVLRTVDANAH